MSTFTTACTSMIDFKMKNGANINDLIIRPFGMNYDQTDMITASNVHVLVSVLNSKGATAIDDGDVVLRCCTEQEMYAWGQQDRTGLYTFHEHAAWFNHTETQEWFRKWLDGKDHKPEHWGFGEEEGFHGDSMAYFTFYRTGRRGDDLIINGVDYNTEIYTKFTSNIEMIVMTFD